MKHAWLFPFALFSACSSAPLDRTEAQQRYLEKESVTQERSMERSELITRVAALDSQIGAIDAQIRTQEGVIRHWESQSDVASSGAMIANARLRIEQLQREREALVIERNNWNQKLQDIRF